MKIIFLGDSISTQKAGIHYFGLQLIKQITETYQEHDYVVISSRFLGLENIKEIVVPIKTYIPYHLRLRQFWVIPNLVTQEDADIVIELAHFGPFNIPSKIKRVTVIHDLSPIIFKEHHNYFSYLAHKFFMPRIVNNADYLICNSNTTCESITELYPHSKNKISVVYPKIEIEDSLVRDKINENYFLTIGTLEPRKNYEKLISGYDFYRSKGGSNKLKIIGAKGWKTKSILKAINDSSYANDIEWLGYVSREKMIECLKESIALISASIFEGFGLPVLEAMSFSKPLILSKIQVYQEIAEDGALYFDTFDSNSMGQALLKSEQILPNLRAGSNRRFEELNKVKLKLPFL